jgi:hypothetical protein
MTKTNLQKFISKYSLNGEVTAVKWTVSVKDKQLGVSAITNDKSLVYDVFWKDFSDLTTNLEIGVYDTDKLQKMLKALGNDITVNINENDGRVTSLTFADGTSEIQFMTAELTVIPKSSRLKTEPPYHFEIDLTEDFIAKYRSAKDALSEETKFTLLMNKKTKKVQLVIGYASINSNRVTLDVPIKSGTPKLEKPLNFNADFFKAVLDANSECENAVLKVSEAGLASVSFNTDTFNSVYHFGPVQAND